MKGSYTSPPATSSSQSFFIHLIPVIVLASLLFTPLAHGEECNPQSSVSASQMVTNISAVCCSRPNPNTTRRCIARSIRRAKKITPLISREVFLSVKRDAKKIRQSSCTFAVTKELSCTSELSTTFTEIMNNVSETACAEPKQSKRESTLKKTRRAWVRARSLMDGSFSQAVRNEVRNLASSEACGAGGEEAAPAKEAPSTQSKLAQCGKIVDPRDGFKIGNVYKMSDHGGKPVFISHNGAKSGEAITDDGDVLQALTYTGLANADNKGLRHHYRMTLSCRSLPESFLLRIGRTCYEIDDRCGRID